MIYFLAPVYNEIENLPRFIRETDELMRTLGREYKMIFVNDGSTDGSYEFLCEAVNNNGRIKVLSHYPNLGVRKTFIEGFRYFIENAGENDILITKEADNTSDNKIVAGMIALIENGDCDIVLASCYARGGGFENTSPWRLFLSKGANTIVKLRFGLWKYNTFSSFFRAFSFRSLKKLAESDSELMSSEGFTCVVEMLIKMHRLKLEIREIPMLLRSSERKGKSKMPVIKTILGYLRLCLSLDLN